MLSIPGCGHRALHFVVEIIFVLCLEQPINRIGPRPNLGSSYTHISEQTQNGLRIDLGGYEKLIRCAFGGCRSLCSRNTKTGRGMMKCSERGWPENSVDFDRREASRLCKGSFVPEQHGETCFRCTWATMRNRAVAYTSSLSIWVLV